MKSQHRYYWPGSLFVLVSALLFALSAAYSVERGALVGAGSALAGAAFTRIADLARERRAEQAMTNASRQRDLDETRRVAYMTLLCRETDHYEVAATTINALVHHGAAIDFDEALRHITAIVKGGRRHQAEAGREWLQRQIDRITAELANRAC